MASAGRERNKQGGTRESGRPPPPSQRGHCRSVPAPRPATAPALRPPGPSGPDPAPEGVRSVGSSQAAPGSGLQRREVPAQLTSPRHQQQRGPGSSGVDSSARLRAAAAVAPAHPPARPTTRLRSGRPLARPGSVRAHLAGLPSLSGTLRSRTRPRPQPGPDSRPGKGAEERARQRVNERDQGTHPPAPPSPPHPPPLSPRPQPQAPRAHAARAPLAGSARPRPPHTPTARLGAHPPVDSGRSISYPAAPRARTPLNLTEL